MAFNTLTTTGNFNTLKFRALSLVSMAGLLLAACNTPTAVPTATITPTPFGAGPTRTPDFALGDAQATPPAENMLVDDHLYVLYRREPSFATLAPGEHDVYVVEYVNSPGGRVAVSKEGYGFVLCGEGDQRIIGLGGDILREPSNPPADATVKTADEVCTDFYGATQMPFNTESPEDDG